MSIKRSRALPTDHFTIIDNGWLRDKRLTFKARGVLAYLMTHAIGWETSVAQLAEAGVEGRDAIQTAINELERLGYLVREQRTGEDGRFAGVDYTITDPGTVDGLSGDGSSGDGLSGDGSSAAKKTMFLEDHQEEDQDQEPSSSAEPAAPLRDDVERMLDYFDSRIEQIGVRRKPNRTKTNRDAARLMLDLDGYEPAEIRQVIDWATADSFWGPNIGSVKKLREKYPQLRARMSGTGQFAPRDTKQNRNLAILDAAEQRWAAEENNHHRMKELL